MGCMSRYILSVRKHKNKNIVMLTLACINMLYDNDEIVTQVAKHAQDKIMILILLTN